MARRNFCELGRWAYNLSTLKQICQRHLSNAIRENHFASTKETVPYPVLIHEHSSDMIKRGPGIDEMLQQNKADNIRLACNRLNGLIIHPGESFSFWHYVGKTSRRNGFKEGRVIINGKLVRGTGGGLCNLANTIHLLVMHSPLTITELHHHSDALAPDPGGKRTPYSAGTSVNYNYIDFRFKNTTEQDVQLLTWCEGDCLHAELRTTAEFPYNYQIIERDHRFQKEEDGNYYRVSTIYRQTLSKKDGKVIGEEIKWRNHSKVMFDPSLLQQ